MSTGAQQNDAAGAERDARAHDAPGTSVEGLAAHIAALSDVDVAALLAARPDLTTPPSASFTALAARAGARPSVEAALARLDAPTLAVAEAVVALGTQEATVLAEALGLEADDVAARLERLTRLSLVIEAGPVPGLVDVFGPHPFGLGPAAADPPPPPPTLAELQTDSGEVSRAALGMLRALAWGPPVGTLRAGGRAPGAAELLERGWLVREEGMSVGAATAYVAERWPHLGLWNDSFMAPSEFWSPGSCLNI